MLNNKILYLKWKPEKFYDFVGQKNILKYIKNVLILNKIHHAYLFTGNKGIGKTTVAIFFSKSINCLNIKNILNNNFPCNKCINCISINNNSFSDFLEIDIAINNSVDDIKNLIESIYYLPTISKYKIYLMDEIHMLSKYGFSALLKSLEQPPKYIIFILITNEINKIPDTIISRCIVFNFNNISNNEIVNRIKFISKKENIKYDIESLHLIANFSKGSIRDSINILEKISLINNNYININLTINILGIIDVKILINIIESIIYSDNYFFSKNFNILEMNEFNYENIFKEIIYILHNLIMLSLNKNYIIDPIFNKYNKKIIKLSENNNLINLKKFYKISLDYIKNLIYFDNKKICFNLFLFESFYYIKNKL